ncbi:MAG: GTP-binding protein [Lachnospiraceae bacterium]
MVKISIISGFLGAGKTTFIRKMLREKYFGSAPVLVENDYGQLGIDSLVMEDTGVQICEMNSGCICCTLIGNFVLALEELIQQRHPEHIIIEPSGVGKLSEILDALNDLEVPFERHLILTIVDARRFYYNNQYVSDYFWDQINSADAVVLSKTKQMTGKELASLCTAIHNKTPDKEVICVPWNADFHPVLEEIIRSHIHGPLCHDETDYGIPAEPGESEYISTQIQTHQMQTHQMAARMISRSDSQASVKSMTVLPSFSISGIRRRRSDVFESWSAETCMEYSNQRLHEIISALEHNKYGAIIRAKGILNNPLGPILLDYVPGDGRLTYIDPEESGRMLVIGMNLNRPALERLFLT